MRIIGLTGGIGSGKSTVSTILRELGATVVDADEGARVVVQPGQPALGEIRDRFGDAVFAADGGLDREKLADVVFNDERARADLNAITHPRVRAWMAEQMQAAAAAGAPAVVLDIPLLFESGLTAGLDEIVVVWAPVEEQFRRAVARGLRGDDVRARIKAQMPIEEKRSQATVVINNAGSKEQTRRQVEELWKTVLSRPPT
jgi:dephospho-CoA kinase